VFGFDGRNKRPNTRRFKKAEWVILFRILLGMLCEQFFGGFHRETSLVTSVSNRRGTKKTLITVPAKRKSSFSTDHWNMFNWIITSINGLWSSFHAWNGTDSTDLLTWIEGRLSEFNWNLLKRGLPRDHMLTEAFEEFESEKQFSSPSSSRPIITKTIVSVFGYVALADHPAVLANIAELNQRPSVVNMRYADREFAVSDAGDVKTMYGSSEFMEALSVVISLSEGNTGWTCFQADFRTGMPLAKSVTIWWGLNKYLNIVPKIRRVFGMLDWLYISAIVSLSLPSPTVKAFCSAPEDMDHDICPSILAWLSSGDVQIKWGSALEECYCPACVGFTFDQLV